ncbi:MAG: AsnC family transcriptional regulator [Nitrososphaerota archaeon]|nr:AsnC family transcriptional regulator [Nitrososphaerota archaeon]
MASKFTTGVQTSMDELDVKILRSLISERAVSPSLPSVKLSLRAIAARLGADDMTVRYRFKKMQESGVMSIWSLLVNPTFLGYKVAEVMVDVQPESAKPDMIRKLKLVHEITGLVNFYGKAIDIYAIYNGDESRSRTIELISRITNAERVTQSRMPMPQSLTKNLNSTDVAIVRALSKDARKSTLLVAKELGLSSKTVRKRVDKLRKENTVLPLPILNIASIPGLIPIYLSYTYSNREVKTSVDREIVSHFDAGYIMGSFADPDTGNVVIGASTMSDVPRFLEWAKSQPGIASARVDIATETFMFPEKLIELLELRQGKAPLHENALFR